MNIGSFFTRALDIITPWNRGGEAQRSQERKKKKEEEQNRIAASRSRAQSQVSNQQQADDQPQIKPQRPENLFQGLRDNLRLPGSSPNTNVSVVNNPNTQPIQQQKPGTIVQPQQQKPEPQRTTSTPQIPKYKNVFERIGDKFEANSPQDIAKRTIAGKPRTYEEETGGGPVGGTNWARRNISPKGFANVGKSFIQGFTRVPEQIFRTVAQPGAEIFKPGIDLSQKEKNTGLRKILYGEEPIQTYYKQSEEAGKATAKATGKPELAKYGMFAAPVLGGLDLAFGGEGKFAKEAAKEGTELGIKKLAEKYGFDLPDELIKLFAGESKAKNIDKVIKNQGEKIVVKEGAKSGAETITKNTPEVVGDNLDVPASVTPREKPSPKVQELENKVSQLSDEVSQVERPAFQRQPAKRALEQAKTELSDARAADLGVGPSPLDRPAFMHKQDIEDVIKQGNDELNNFVNDNPGATPQQIADAKAAIEGQVVKKTDELTKARYGESASTPTNEPTINVKEPNSIPLTDQTNVPTGLPEEPGTVRATQATAPMQAETQAVANTPVVNTPADLPKEVQAVLDNPKQFNKRQVAAARNQRKLANQMAKTQEQTAEAMARIETASPAAQSGEGFVPTGEFAKSVNGGPIQKASRKAEMEQAVQETANMSPQDVIQTARINQNQTGGFNRRDIRNIAALFEQKRLVRGTPEWEQARQILKEDGTVWGQQGALRNYTMRRNASVDELISRYESKIYRLADDPTKIDSKLFDQIESAENAFVEARDNASAAYNEFTRNPTSANANAYHAAQDLADKADMAAKRAEYSIANKALKGNKDVGQIRELEKMANQADLYQMDAVDASMLSGTGTFLRNTMNAATGGVEETLFGKIGAKIASLTPKSRANNIKIAGGVGKGSVEGFGKGVNNLVDASKARAENAGWNPLEHLKNWSTTGNEIGDTIMDAQAIKNTKDHYVGLLKAQGYKGQELVDRASVMARQDPDGVLREYQSVARVAAGLGNGITKNNRFETFIRDNISNIISGGKPTPLTEATGKLVARITVGFPTAIARSTGEGIKRFTLGAPTFIKALREADPLKRAVLIKEGVKQAGTGALILPPLFYALGNAGVISGSYPSDKEERAQWERDGKTENSIKIGGAWYQLPAYLGAWALPGLFYASLGRSNGDFGEATKDTAKAVPALLPTDQASNVLDVINGRSDFGKFLSQTGASAVRAVTPAGALLNQFAKSLDPTKNDTSSGSNIENFVNKVLSGIPGADKLVDIPDKTSDTGAPITNPNPLEIFGGASSDVQGGGEARSKEIQSQTNSDVENLGNNGIFDDPNIKEVLGTKELAIYNKIKAGKSLKEGELDDLKKGLTKGVSSTGEDTAYLEREQYDSNLAVLKLKRDQMAADKSVKPSDIEKVDIAIKRGEVYKNDNIPYDLISAYKETGVAEWRKMGDPEDEDYNPEMYQALFDIDSKLTEAGVSYKKGSLEKPKYTAKEPGKGRGGGKGGRGGARQVPTDFGTLKTGSFAPRVQQYDSIDAKSGSIPVIRKVRPNIVHKISSSG